MCEVCKSQKKGLKIMWAIGKERLVCSTGCQLQIILDDLASHNIQTQWSDNKVHPCDSGCKCRREKKKVN